MNHAITLENFCAGDVILNEGEVGDRAYVVRSGAVAITSIQGGTPVQLAELGPGELFGEMSLIDQQSRSATATALEDTEALVIDRSRVEFDLARSEPLIQFLLRVLVARLRSTDSHLVDPRPEETGRFLLSALGLDADSGSNGEALERARGKVLENLDREQDLQRALDQDELELFYQPIVNLDDRRIVGFEALMRWRHPERGLVPPSEFIDLAESSGLIVPMGLRAMEDACAMLAEVNYLATGITEPLYVTVNVSAAQLAEPQLIERLPQILDDSGLEPGCLRLEITENLLMEDPDLAVAALDEIKAMGVQLSIDDFGTGYSSLSYLKKFPLDTLKIDRSFVCTMLDEPVSEQIVRAVANLASDLQLEIVAEGVEEEAQLDALRALGCHCGQGYLFAPPLPRSKILVMLHRGGRFATELRPGPRRICASPNTAPSLPALEVTDPAALEPTEAPAAPRVVASCSSEASSSPALAAAAPALSPGKQRGATRPSKRSRAYDRALLASSLNEVMETQVLRG